MKICKDCIFWKKWTHCTAAYLAKYPQNENKGDCHKNAPAVVGLSEEGYTCWPDTESYDFCGEFKPKENQTHENNQAHNQQRTESASD